MSKAAYDYALGVQTEDTDLNGNTVTMSYDAQGRMATVTSPYEAASGQPYTIRFAYAPQAPVPRASTAHFDVGHPTDPIETVTFMDGLGRVLQTKKADTLSHLRLRPTMTPCLRSPRRGWRVPQWGSSTAASAR